MTRRTKSLYKLANAIRAFKGGFYTPQQKTALPRIRKWATICKASGYVLAMFAMSLLAASTTNAPNVAFLWQYPNPSGPFLLYGTTNIGLPTSQWPIQATWTNWGTNIINGQVYLSNAVYQLPAQSFFFMATSNFWGLTPPSTVVSVPAPAQIPQSVSIQYIGP